MRQTLKSIGDTNTLGKPKGADAARAKPTFASLLGTDNATHRYQQLYTQALKQLKHLD